MGRRTVFYSVGIVVCMAALIAFAVFHTPDPSIPPLRKSSGRLIYAVRTAARGDQCVRVFECDLRTGQSTPLFATGCWNSNTNAGMSVRDVYIDIAPGGGHLAVWEEISSGDMESNYLLVGPRIWSRSTGKLERVLPGDEDYDTWWSPSGRYLIAELDDRSWIYDTRLRKLHRLCDVRGLKEWVWSADERQILICDDRGGCWRCDTQAGAAKPEPKLAGLIEWQKWDKTNRFLALHAPSNGQSTVYTFDFSTLERKVLFTWPTRVQSLAPSPDLKTLYLVDSNSLHRIDSAGRSLDKAHIDAVGGGERICVSGMFNKEGSRVVLHFWEVGQDPDDVYEDRFAIINGGNLHFFGSEGESASLFHYSMAWAWVDGWLTDGRHVMLTDYVQTTGRMPVLGKSGESWVLWSHDMMGSPGNRTDIFDGGPGCIGMTWWSGEKPE